MWKESKHIADMPFTPETALTGTQFKPGQSGNPAGLPKGTKHITTHIQELLNDEKFSIMVQEGYEIKEYKGKPLTAILHAQIKLALQSKDESIRIKATELLLKHGWSQKIEQENTGEQKLIIETRRFNADQDN